MPIVEVRPHLYRIFLPQQIIGFQRFIGSWLFEGEYTFLVDVGPRSSFEELLAELKARSIRRLDFVFLTHIHIDHAGATGLLTRHFPDVKVICHSSGIQHLVDPQKLWEGSKKILGDLALSYGEIEPVPAKNLCSSEDFSQDGFKLIDSPGHAPHHISVLYDDFLFSGEAAGVFLDVNGEIYLRPATPVRFVFEEAVASVDRLLEVGGREICYAHTWIHPDAAAMLRRFRDQLVLWRDTVSEQLKNGKKESLLDRCAAALIERDESLRRLPQLSEDERERESYFIRNSVQGFVEYLAGKV